MEYFQLPALPVSLAILLLCLLVPIYQSPDPRQSLDEFLYKLARLIAQAHDTRLHDL